MSSPVTYLLTFSSRLKTIGLLAAQALASLAGATAFAALVLDVLDVLEVLELLELALLVLLVLLETLLATCLGSVLAKVLPAPSDAHFLRGFGGTRVGVRREPIRGAEVDAPSSWVGDGGPERPLAFFSGSRVLAG